MYIPIKVTDNYIFTLDGQFIGTKGTSWSFYNRFEINIMNKQEKTAFYGYLDSSSEFHEFCNQPICRPRSCPLFGKKDCKYNKSAQNISGYYMLDD